MSTSQSSLQTLVTFRNSQGDPARGTLLKIDRTVVVLEVYNPYSIVQLSEVLHELTIRRGERKIYRGRAVVNNLVNTGLMLIVSAALVDPWTDLQDIIGSGQNLRQEAERFVSDWSASSKVRSGYQLVVGEVQSLFSDLSRWLDQLDIAGRVPNRQREPSLSDEYFSELLEPITSEAARLFGAFEEEASLVANDTVAQHKSYAQKCLHPLIMRSPFPFRAFVKPLGYAGDYEMVNMMLRDPREGPTTYAEVVNTLYLRAGPAQAHRNRIKMLVDLLVSATERARVRDRPLRVLNVGCGPAVELENYIVSEDLYPDTYINLIDFNQETLDYTKERIANAVRTAKVRPSIDYTHLSVHELLRGAATNEQPAVGSGYDLVYCAGLFDYLSDRVCSRLLRLFYRLAAADGVVAATNVHPRNSALYLMEHILDWFLIYRDEQAMSGLAKGMGKQQVYCDETGINVFLRIERQGRYD